MNSFDRLMYDITGLTPEERQAQQIEYDKRREEADDADRSIVKELEQMRDEFGLDLDIWEGEPNR